MSRLVRIQLVIFSIITVISLVTMGVVYLRIPTALGWDRTDAALEIPDTGGLYPSANVSYLGTVVGIVDSVNLRPATVRAEFHVRTSANIPENVRAEIRSVSAVGEQYIDLVPTGTPRGSLAGGTVISGDRVAMPVGIGPVLDQAHALLASVDDAKLKRVLSQAFDAFHGSDRALQSLLDSTRLLLQEAQANSGITTQLIRDAEPFLDSQLASGESIRAWSRNLAAITEQLRTNEPQLTSLMTRGPDALDSVTDLMNRLQPTLPVLVANLVSVGEVGVVYNRSVEQILVLYPALVSALLTAINGGKSAGAIKADFNLQINKPPACTTGFIPAADRRSPADFSVPAQINGLYCKIPSDSTMSVRGARNIPCVEYPGRRGASPDQCAAGGYPAGDTVGSNPPDTRDVGPPDLTLHPPGQDPPASAPGPREAAGQPAGVRYSSAATYDPRTGDYVASDGRTYRQTDLAQSTKTPPGATLTQVLTNGVIQQ